jgi:hypothetical protein
MLDTDTTHTNESTTLASSTVPTLEEFEHILFEVVGWMHKSFLPVMVDGLLIEKPRSQVRVSKRALRALARKLHPRLVSLSQLDVRSVTTRKNAVRLVGDILRELLPKKGIFKTSRTANPLLNIIRFKRKQLRELRKLAGMTAKEQQATINSVVLLYDLASAGSPTEQQTDKRWGTRSIVATLQGLRRIWKGLAGPWPRRTSGKLQRLARTYADAAIVFEHLLKYHLELLSASPPAIQIGITCPSKKATLGWLVGEARKLEAFTPLLADVNVSLRNAIQHGSYRITMRPARFVWSGPNGETIETVRSMTRGVRRLAGQAIVLFMSEQIAVMTKLEHLMENPPGIGEHHATHSIQPRL